MLADRVSAEVSNRLFRASLKELVAAPALQDHNDPTI
jgi:hypothetical protein